uniref:Mannose receptor, C type 1b n=1 Tax=Periophthalmus magnuspinnatus TaxID=409849 RepID=A0A3B4A4A9_9GOBI
KATGLCLARRSNRCVEVRWTTGNRLFVTSTKKCLGAQGKTLGSEVSLYDCDDQSELQKWECRNNTLLQLKGQNLYVELRTDESIVLSRNLGPNNHLTIVGSNISFSPPELYTIGGNARGKPCMFPFMYKDRWYGECTTYDSSIKRSWCAIETKFEHELWGYCPSTCELHWVKNSATGAYYQINIQSALTWSQAQVSCKQQGASLLSITDPNEQAFVSGMTIWIGLVLDPDHGWQWTNGQPFRYLRWTPGKSTSYYVKPHNQHIQLSTCGKQLGYICSKSGLLYSTVEQGFCASPWIPYSGHCFHLHREAKTWSDAVKDCRKEGGDLISIRHVEDQSFVISQLGYAATDELWIGLNDQRTEGLFEWIDQSPVLFSTWQYGEPSVSGDLEDCVLMTGEKGNWADRSCEEKHGFICMKQSSHEPTGEEVTLDVGCKPNWKRHGSYCYFVGTETKTFDEANNDCKRTDSYLADVSNGVDNAFLVSLVGIRPEKYFWIGLSNMVDIDRFAWTNTDQVRFTHWNANMPGYEQGCVAITTGVMAGLWDLLPCTNKEKYICKHQAEGAVVTQPPPTVSPPKCPDGWNKISSRNYCSKFFTGPRANEKTWFEAREYCRDIGGDLLSIHSRDELRVARHGKAWIGLYVPDANTGYAWSDGSPVNFQHWQEGEPNNFNNAEACAEFTIYNWDERGSWNDVNCEAYSDWLCQIPPRNDTVTGNNTVISDGWLEWKGNQYYINKVSLSMEEARKFCQQKHGDLVTITNRAENTFIWKQISRHYGRYYIGLSVDLDGSFWWMSNTPVEFLSWDQNQPKDNVDQNCVIMTYYMGFWSNCNCGEEVKSICKRSSSAPVNTTVAPTTPPTGGCPLKWMQFNSKCYSIINNRKTTWEDARKQCITMGGNLVSIPSRYVQGLTIFYLKKKNKKNPKHIYIYKIHTIIIQYIYHMINLVSPPGFGKWLIKSCNDTNGFVCVRDPILPNAYLTLANDSLKVVTQNLSWADAKVNCEKDQAKLASLRNEWTQSFVELMARTLNAPLWIGLNKQQTNGFYRFIDGWYMNFANWASGEPRQDKPCVYMDVEGKWKTAFCNTTMNSVCLQSTDVAPTQSTEYPGACPEETEVDYRQSYTWIPYKAHCYLFVTEEVEWGDAASSCARHGGRLASIEDPSEQEFIEGNVKLYKDAHTSFWVGLFKSHKGTRILIILFMLVFFLVSMHRLHNDILHLISAFVHIYLPPESIKFIILTFIHCAEPLGPQQHLSRTHNSLAVVLVIVVISALVAAVIFYYKRSPKSFPTFENPLYTERSQPDVVDTKNLIEKVETEEEIENTAENNAEPIISL